MTNARGESLKGKAVLITGAARRLGRDMALAAARAGADVAITFLTSQHEARETVVDIAGLGGRAVALRCDVRDEKNVQEAVKECVLELGGIDILINNAGFYETVDFEKLTVAQWDRMFQSNTRGPFLMSRAALKPLRARKGRIINLGSLGGVKPWADHAHYCASKAALHMLTKVMAKALAPEIAVNCVAPGMIELAEEGVQERAVRGAAARKAALASHREFMNKMRVRTPMKTNGTAADITEAVMFFASASRFITGQIMVVDGGLELV
jgi:3-oxoacyl-[acyl-carrier protein] reductase/pteridine reductase